MDILQLRFFTRGMAFMFVIVLCIYFIFKQERLKKFLGYVLLFWVVTGLKGLILLLGVEDRHYWEMLLLFVDMIGIPVCVFLLMEIFKPYYVGWARVLRHCTPYVALLAIYAVTGWDDLLILTGAYSVVYCSCIVLRVRRAIKCYQRAILDNYSNIDTLNVNWLQYTTYIFFGFLFIWLIACLLNTPWFDCIYFVTIIVLWGDVAYHMNRQSIPDRAVMDSAGIGDDEDEEKSEICDNDESNEVVNYAFVENLETLMRENEYFLNQNITMNDLAHELCTNRTYLSNYINTTLNLSFYDYINNYRLEKATELLLSTDKTIEEVVEMSGFKSMSTFQRYFHKRYGTTPNKYRKMNALAVKNRCDNSCSA